MEGWKEQDTAHFVSAGMIAIHNVLHSESPSFTKNAPECQLRLVLVQILVRVSLPQTEGSREMGVKLLELMLHLLANDNDDIGMHAVKAVLDLNRFLRLPDDRYAIAFVQLVEKIYGNLEQQVEKEFNVSALSEPADPNVLRRSMHSFKLLAECPFNIVILMQLHRNSINQTVRILLLPLTTVSIINLPLRI
jgi:transformation/transcription domain-associated protein